MRWWRKKKSFLLEKMADKIVVITRSIKIKIKKKKFLFFGVFFAVLNISTSTQLAFPISQQDFIPPATSPNHAIEYFPYFSNTYIATVASLTGGSVMANFVQTLGEWLTEFGKYTRLFFYYFILSLLQILTALNSVPPCSH